MTLYYVDNNDIDNTSILSYPNVTDPYQQFAYYAPNWSIENVRLVLPNNGDIFALRDPENAFNTGIYPAPEDAVTRRLRYYLDNGELMPQTNTEEDEGVLINADYRPLNSYYVYQHNAVEEYPNLDNPVGFFTRGDMDRVRITTWEFNADRCIYRSNPKNYLRIIQCDESDELANIVRKFIADKTETEAKQEAQKSPLIVSTSLKELINSMVLTVPVARLLNKALHKKRYCNAELPGNYFSYREKAGMISYCPSNRTQGVTDDGTWERKGRQEMKPAKFVRAILCDRLNRHFKDDAVQQFSTQFRNEELAGKITVKEAPSIENAYTERLYVDQDIMSCMWNDPVQAFYDMFGAKALVAVDGNGMYHGRAILWPEVTVTGVAEPVQYMDRIYTNKPEITTFFKAYAREHGMYRRAHSCSTVINPDGDEVYLTMRVETVDDADLDTIDYYPYMDTFKSGETENCLINTEDDKSLTRYTNQDGTRSQPTDENEHEGEVQTLNGDWIDEDDAIEVNGNYYDRDDDDITYCDRSEEYVLACETYTVQTSRNETMTIHERYVTQNG